MTEKRIRERAALANHLNSRREAILEACRAAAKADPEQTTIDSLTRAQFNDHLPEVLDAFQKKVSARPRNDAESATVAVNPCRSTPKRRTPAELSGRRGALTRGYPEVRENRKAPWSGLSN